MSESKVRLHWAGRKEYTRPQLGPVSTPQKIANIYPQPLAGDNPLWSASSPKTLLAPENRMFCADNLEVICYLLEDGYKGRFNLIYIDPPYLTNQKYLSRIEVEHTAGLQSVSRQVFTDPGVAELDSFLEQIYPRLQLMKDLLADNGSLFVHLDWHVSHYVKVLLDEIFYPEGMINEIVWCYGGGGSAKRHFHRKHDLILWYAKGKDYTFNPQYRPYTPGTLQRGLTKVKGNRYRLHNKGALMQDWWADINKILSPTAYENLKFPTQKPLALLERIILAASNPGDLVGDFYAGSATLAQVCESNGRNWVSCDNSPIAIETGVKRLIRLPARPFCLENLGSPLSAGPGSLVLKEPLTSSLKSGETLLHLGIASYDPGREAKRAHLVYYLDFWELDLSYDGVCFNSELQVVRDSNRIDSQLPLDVTVRLPESTGPVQVALKVHDIFGCTALAVVKVG